MQSLFFFDAEKIAELASLGAKDQALLINQAFNQILGLSNYENLVDDLEEYGKELSKKEAKGELMIQIGSFENQIKSNKIKVDTLQEEQENIDEQLTAIDIKHREVLSQLYKRGDISLKKGLDEVKNKKQNLTESLDKIKIRFHDASELIPFAILAPFLEEANDHINREDVLQKRGYQDDDLKEKTKELAEKLFNKPPFPDNDLDMETKLFYYKKAQSILSDIIQQEQDEEINLSFKHELDRSESIHVSDVLQTLNLYNKDTFETIFSEYIRVSNDLVEASTELKKIEAFNEDEFIADLQSQKRAFEEERSTLEKRKGVNESEILRSHDANKQSQVRLDNLLEKVKVSKETEKQKKVLENYIKTLREFIQQQKQQKKISLKKNLLSELKRLIKKPNLIDEVNVDILSNNLGLEIKLYNKSKKETNPSTDMSKGEQQLYISALLKAILSESIYELPVFIDTPLGRLDQEHRDNILSLYYPELSEQVVILSTNTEVRNSDLPKIEKHISKLYRLDNKDNKTQVIDSYFPNT